MPEIPANGGGLEEFDATITSLLRQLDHDPENLQLHRQLREVALRRQAAGGKPAGGFLGPTLPFEGKGQKQKMLNAEYVLAHDAANIPAMMDLYRAAEAAAYEEVAEWIGQLLRETTRGT